MSNRRAPCHLRAAPRSGCQRRSALPQIRCFPSSLPHWLTLTTPGSGNAAILKGEKESAYTTAALARAIRAVLTHTVLPPAFVQTVETRAEVAALLARIGISTLSFRAGATRSCRPSNTPRAFPSWGTRDGLCAINPNEASDGMKAQRVVLDAKVRTCAGRKL